VVARGFWRSPQIKPSMDVGRRPEIFQGDQGCQFISGDFVARVHAEEIKISRAGRKRW